MIKIRDVSDVLGELAPLHRAQEWDNVGLLVGDEQAACRSILLTIDLTDSVLSEAVENKCSLVMAYHPPLFKPVSSLRAQSSQTDAIVWQAIRNNISIYAMHTALDAAEGGTNEVLAELCGAADLKPFEYVDEARRECKVVVFVPRENVNKVAEAMSAAGAGYIGDYERCSFRIPGIGTFLSGEGTSPTVGQAGQFETVEEIRLEMVVTLTKVPAVVQAIRQSHTYEEPAYDIYPLQPQPVAGIGRLGRLTTPTALSDLVERLKKEVSTQAPQIIGDSQTQVSRVAVCVGAAGSLPFKLKLGLGDCLVTGEIRHHDALALERVGSCAIALGHWASERPALVSLSNRLKDKLPNLTVRISHADRDPFQPV